MSTAAAAPRPDFRPDLEGVRGAAVLLVVLYHAAVPGLAGGFVGVDVFFVLSGYFITALLVREVDATRGVDLSAFYARRALRLLPPLLLVLVATLGLAMWLWAPVDRAAVALSARAAALGAPNVHFAREAVDYFGGGEDPLLHTWSLGVEQQFYLVWPLLVAGVALLAARPARGLRAAALVAGGLSFAAALWSTGASPAWAFFGLPARAWEFAAGAGLALALSGAAARARPALGTVLQAAGLAAIGAAVLTYQGTMPYPGAAALVPVFGTAALVTGGRLAPAGPVGRALGAPALRWLGGVSYAWYLWHWPLVSLGLVLDPGIGVPGRMVWSLGALGLAWLTTRFVERPARTGRLARWSPGVVSAAAFGATAAVALTAHLALRAAERRVQRPDQRAFALARDDRMRHRCWATTVDRLPGPCVFGDTTSRTTVMLFGDSHAEHWLGALDRAGRARGWRVVAMVKGGCPVADAPELIGGRRAAYGRACARYREAMVRRILAMRPAAAVLSSWDHYVADGPSPAPAGRVTPAAWERGLRRTYARLAGAGVPVVVVRGTPRTGFDVPSCLSRRAAGLPFARACTYARDSAFVRGAVAAQTAALRGLRVGVVDMNDQICAGARCPTVRGGTVVFTDDNHLTASFSRSVAGVFGARVAGAAGGRLP